MTLTGISNRGLLAISILVVILWGCIFAERAIIHQARRQTMEQFRPRGPVPVKFEKKERPRFHPGPSRAFAG